MMYLASVVTCLLLFAGSFRYSLAIEGILIGNGRSFLSFANPSITITLTFDIAVESISLLGEELVLSNLPDFNPFSCTFSSLSFTLPIQTSDVHTITLSASNTTQIKTAIGNFPGIDCLADNSSTFLLISPSQSTFVELGVVPDLTSPQVTFSRIDFKLGTIVIVFTEPVIINPFNVSGMLIEASDNNIPQPQPILLSNLTNAALSIEPGRASVSYTILLEVFELSVINTICPSFILDGPSCNLILPASNFTTDVFGNSINPSPDVISVGVFIPFSESDWGASSIITSPLSFNQANLTFSAPILLRPNDTVYYRVYSLAGLVCYYYGSCDYPWAYEIQLDSQLIRSSLSSSESLPCENTSDYFCYVTNDLSLVVDLFVGVDHFFCIETVYPEFSLFSTCTTLTSSDHYRRLLNFELTTASNQELPPNNGSSLSAEGNRALLTWQTPDASFCDQHKLTVRYTSLLPLHNIELDSDTLCGSQYLYIYIYIPTSSEEFISVYLDLRTTTPLYLIPNNTCIFTRISFSIFPVNSAEIIDVPVIESITAASDVNIEWSSFPLTTMEHFNVYVFPVYALKFNGGSCSSIDSQTPGEQFSFFPTEYYEYGVRIPSQIQFNLTCPPSPGESLPYQCHSVSTNNLLNSDNFLSVRIDPTYAIGVIIEAVTLSSQTRGVLTVRSYPAVYSAWGINLGTSSGIGYQDITWDPDFCLPTSSVFLRVLEPNAPLPVPGRRSIRALSGNSFSPLLLRNFITPCNSTPTFLKDIPFAFFTKAYIFTNSETEDGSACLSGFESNQLLRVNSNIEPVSTVIEFTYLDFNTISLSIAIFGTFNQPATVYFLPYQIYRLELDNVTDQCPVIMDETDLSASRINITILDNLVVSPPLICENTSTYSCIFVENTADITIDIIPGFDQAIRFNTSDNVETILPGTNGVPTLYDRSLMFRQTLLYTSTQLISQTSILVEWDTNFYCPPEAFVYIFWDKNDNSQPPPINQVILPCEVGSFLITNLDYSTRYYTSADVFFNSTVFSPSCATLSIEFRSVRTADFIQNIQLVDFANVNVQWDLVPGVTSYTLLAVPQYLSVLTTQINSVFSSDLIEQIAFIEFSSSPDFPLDALFEMCLNSDPDLTCSKLSTATNNAILTFLPGYEYNIAVAYELGGVDYIQSDFNLYAPFESVVELIAISEFNLRLLFDYNSQICSNSSRTVFLYETQDITGDLFKVVPCNESTFELQAPNSTTPGVLFIFPYQPIKFPGNLSVVNNPVHSVVYTSGLYSSLPVSASPLLTSLDIPMDPSDNVYRAEWSNSPVLQIQQQFESYILYAIPFSGTFTLTDQECPQYIYPDCFLGGPIRLRTNRNLIFDICPGYGQLYFFCEEFGSSLQGELTLFPLLDYLFFVEAVYDGGLRTSNLETANGIINSNQSLLESLRLTYQVSTSSIEISWDTTSNFCLDSTISFIYSSQVDPSIVVACQTGVYTIESLRSLTKYDVYVYFNYDPTRLYPSREQCIRSIPQIAFNPSPVTASICLIQQPCGTLGMCSEGDSINSFFCDCLAGYEFDGNTCIDVDECNSDVTPCADSACVNSAGSFSCICFEGYTLAVNGECIDTNECDFPENCVNGICENSLPPENYICECEPSYEGRTCNISVGIPACPSFTEQTDFGIELTFPATALDTDASISCSQLDSTLFGTISSRCNSAGVSEIINYQNCLSASFLSLQSNDINENTLLTAEESVMQSFQLVSATSVSNGVLYPGEVMQAVAGLQAIRNSLLNLTGNELDDTLRRVQDNIVRIASNVLRSENRIAFIISPLEEVESEIDTIVSTVETLGILLGSVIPVNSSILIEEQNVALVVTVVSNPVDAIFIGPSSIPNSFDNPSALSRAQASVTIPASVVRANDIGNGLEVSFSVYPNLAQILGEVEAEVPRSPRQRSVNDTLSTAVTNLNIITRGVGPVEQLNEDILLSFGLLFDPPLITNFVKFSLIYTCVSSQRIEEGWVSSGTSLSNSNQVPPGPAQCSVSHLTNFAVLGSAVSLNLTPEETLAIEIISYLLGSISIIFLIISVLAYIILWIRTRKQSSANLFKKDAYVLHFNFAVALLLALVFFVSSAGAYSNRTACLALTILQYYFWLSVFTASLVVGLYLLIKILFWDSERRLWYFLVPLSWGLPIPLVIITPAITHEYIIDDVDEVCWLSNEPTFVSLAFIIPMSAVTLLNLVFLIMTAITLFKASKGKGSKFIRLRSVLFATLLLVPLLGIPWLFSAVANIPTPATAFIFTIVIGLQGFLFTILYPLNTPEIIKYVFLWKPIMGNFPTTTNNNTSSNPSKPPAALKYRIKRRGDSQDPFSNNNVSQPSEAKNEFLDIQLEPVTIENSLLPVQNQRAKDMQSSLILPNPLKFSTSISVPGEEHTPASLHSSIKVPYESLPVDKDY